MLNERSPNRPLNFLDSLQIKKVEETSTDPYRGWSAVDYRARSGALWRVHKQLVLVSPRVRFTNLDARQITEKLREKAKGFPFSEQDKKVTNHWKTVQFLATNWEELSRGLYDEHTARMFSPQAFVGVDVGRFGRADLVGIGMDGRVFVIEAGEGRKRRRLQQVVQGVQALLPDLHPASIFPLLASCVDETKGSLEQYRLQLYMQPIDIGLL